MLMVYSSADIGEWEQIFNSTALREFYSDTDSNSTLIPVFLSLVDSTQAQKDLMAASLELQFQDTQIDAVISVSPEAGTFIRRYSEQFAPGAPRLYVIPGVDILDAQHPQGDVILRSAVDIAAQQSLALIPQLFPEVDNIIVVGGSGSGDLSYLQRIQRAYDITGLDIPLTLLSGLPPLQLVEELANSSPDAAILLSTYDTDSSGQFQRAVLVSDLLDDSVERPVFALFDTQIGRGAIGGSISSATLYAERMVEIVFAMVRGNELDPILDAPLTYRFDGEQLQRFGVNLGRLPANSEIVNEPVNYMRENASWIFAALAVFVVQLILIAALLNAIRRRRLAEEELKTTQKMEALGSLAGGIAHDFNNILMAIMANAELAKATLNDPKKADTRLSNILSASNRAKGLISQILMFSRQTATQSFDELQLGSLVAESVDQISSFLPRQCDIRLHVDDDLPAVHADSNQLHQAIMNICINAQHAMNNDGLIDIEVRKISLQDDRKIFGTQIPAGDYVSVSISDNGQGIRQEDLHHIFEPFYTTKPSGKGTGLGLALVYRIVRTHGAYIDVQSQPGNGTTFTIYLPASAEGTATDTPGEVRLNTSGNGERIMLVDDDDMVLDATQRTLEKMNYQVDSFRSSLQALNAFKENPDNWRLLFTDLSMPEMDGARLASQIRQLNPQIPVVLYTGYLDAVESIEMENLYILKKPSRFDDIAQAVLQSFAQTA